MYERFLSYLDLTWALDVLRKYYPKYYADEIILLAEDIYRWLNDELPSDSSTLAYLKSLYASPTEALRSLWNDVNLLAAPFTNRN